MNLLPLDAAHAPLTATQAIEASAGTGKTWSIAALYLRLVVEAGLTVERILVVTYTTSATAELRERIRARLIAARAAFASGEPGDDVVLTALLPRVEAARAGALLTLAIESFDLAAIHTIHGFCQRALEERAFESGEDFETTLVSDESALLQAVTRDFWRREMAAADGFRARWLTAKLKGPEGLGQALRGHFGRPYLHRLLPEVPDGVAESNFTILRDEMRTAWLRDGQRLCEMLIGWVGLHQQSYKPGQITKAAAEIELWFAAGADFSVAPLDALKKFGSAALTKATTGKAVNGTPQDPLFDRLQALADSVEALSATLDLRLGHLLARALAECEEALGRRKAQLGRLGFDDLLTRLADALQGEGGARLAERIRQRYGAALIDEFQDTDPVQYAIFDRVFHQGGMPLFFVGDPKQAIYSFRGADLQAYLAARDQASEHWALTTNRRSVPGLVAAVNALFARREKAFRCEGLEFAPVDPSPTPPAPLTIAGAEACPMTLWFLRRDEVDAKGKPKSLDKGTAHERIAAAVALDIAGLLARAARGEAKIGERSLNGGDIAVLVKSHRQGLMMQNALAAVDVACVRYGLDSVFDSREALEVERLLLAVAEPGRSGLVKAALATDLLGRRGVDLYALDQDETAWEAISRRFHEWHQRCRERGFIVMWHALLTEEKVAERLLLRPDGERRMTNLQHLSDLLQQLAHDEGLGPDALAKHLADSRRGEGDAELIDAEARMLRLESDEQLVKIVTIHGSKGLEYPVVYCPWLWDGGEPKGGLGPVVFHDREEGGRGSLDFGSARLKDHDDWAKEDRSEEQLRLAYVALTRAKHRCVVVWGGIKEADKSPLGWLLHGPLDLKERDDDQLLADLAELTAACPAVEVMDLPEADATPLLAGPSPESGLVLRARAFPGPLAPGWRTHSFTAWAAAEMEAEQPDHDALVALANAGEEGTQATNDGSPQEVSDFPRGASAGVCLHALLEQIDFARFNGQSPDGRSRRLVDEALAEAGIPGGFAPVAIKLLADVLGTPLAADTPCLADLSAGLQKREMEFLFPIGLPDMAALAAAIGPGQGADGRLDQRVARLAPIQARGFLKGFIDLVFEHEGRLHLLDYKSNWLGPRFADYSPEALAAAMAAEDYDLQALLYSVALHRLQAWRRPGYSCEMHVGGAWYLFLRGMGPDRPGSGVFHWQVPAEMVLRVDACLARQERLVA